MDKYKGSLTSRALRDLDDIYVYIAQTLLVPETALGLVSIIDSEKNRGFCYPNLKSWIYFAVVQIKALMYKRGQKIYKTKKWLFIRSWSGEK